jgi:cephalosporin-C deacetylase-like acetyl esterase
VDKDRIGICGGSQGGALSIVTGALDSRPKVIFANYPALCDIAGYYRGSTGGWPHIYKNCNHAGVEDKVKVSGYYDVVNFARRLKTPILVVMGYNDKVCPPTSTWGAYNSIPGDKQLWLFRECAHWLHPHHVEREQMWLVEQLKR